MAAQLLEQVLKSNLKNLGQDHIEVSINQANLAIVYRKLGEYTQAALLFEHALSTAIKNFGQDHYNVAICQLNLAITYYHIQRFDEAKGLFEQAKITMSTTLGITHEYYKLSESWLKTVNESLSCT